MSDRTSSYFSEIGGDFKGIQGDISGGIITQYIITQQSGGDIRSQPLIPGSPYMGLNKFQTEDKDKFFGRDGQILSFSRYIEQNNLLLLIGVSGSGKSSLVLAGLIPHFKDKWGTSKFSHLTFVPSQDPFKSLNKKIPDEYSNIVDCLAPEPTEDILIQLVNRIKQDYEKQLICIDQFEELFTLTSRNKQELFIKCLLRLIQQQDPSIHLVMTMRSDFLGSLSPHPELATALEGHIRIIKDMTRDELRLAIAEPAARNHVTFEGRLVETIIDDFLGQAGSLPLLQYTLDLLWEKDKELDGLTDQILNVSTYEIVGGVAGALQKQANRIYNQLTEAEQKIAQQIFLDLVDIVDEKRVSKPVELARFQDGGVQEKVVNTLVENRLLVRGTEESETKPMVQVAHEELLRSWEMLDVLFKEKEEIILLRRRLVTDANQWQELRQNDPQKATDELWGGSKLERVLELIQVKAIAGLNKPVEQFIKASVAWRDRTLKEKQEQIDNLNRALTETSLREKAARVLNLLQTQPLDALVLSIQAMGENVDRLPQKILTPVQSSLNIAMEQARVPICFEADQRDVNAIDFSFKSQRIVGGNSDGKLYLWDLQGNPISEIYKSHDSWIAKVAFSPDGQKIISVYGDGTLGLCNLQGTLIGKPLCVHREGIRLIAFNPDNDRIVSSSIISVDGDRSLYLWDLQGNLICNLLDEMDENWAESVIFSPDGQKIVASISESKRRKLCLWDLQGNLILIDDFFYDSERQIMSLTISPDSQIVVAGNSDGTLCLWNLQKSDSKIFKQDGGSVSSVAFSPDGQMIVTGSWDGTLHLRDLQGNSIGQTFRGHRDNVESVIFSPDSQIIASGSRDKTLRLWDLKGNLINQPLREHNNWVSSVAFSPDAKVLVSTESSGGILHKLYFWDLQGNAVSQPFRGHKNLVTSVAFSPDGQQIVSGSEDKTLLLWNLQGEQINKPFVGHETRVESVAFSADGQKIASGGWGWDGKIRLWNLQGDEITKSSVLEDSPKHENSVNSVTFSPDGKIVSGGLDGTLHLWDAEGTHICQFSKAHNGAINSVAFNADGLKIISGGWYRELHLWDSEGKHICQLPEEHHGEIKSVAFSPDGEKIVTGESDRKIGLWDVQNNCIIRLFIAHESDVNSVAFSPDGQIILSSGSDGRISLWDLQGNPIVQTLQGHENSVKSATFSSDGQTIVSGGIDGTVRLWRGHWLSWLQVCCERMRYHPAFKNPQTEDEKRAYDIANRYVYNPQIGADELYRKAKQKITAKDYPAAVDILTLAIQLNPDHLQAYRYRGLAFFHLQQYHRAIKDCDHTLQTLPNDADSYYARGLCHAKLGNQQQATTDFQQAAHLYEQQGQPEKAQKIPNLLTLQ